MTRRRGNAPHPNGPIGGLIGQHFQTDSRKSSFSNMLARTQSSLTRLPTLTAARGAAARYISAAPRSNENDSLKTEEEPHVAKKDLWTDVFGMNHPKGVRDEEHPHVELMSTPEKNHDDVWTRVFGHRDI
ncbi:unnamed protein product [Aphanomyces euteiches]|uniref:Uncharacterized protein n=1 Tax=Aphanomyces euteiches TaxID=100861 RepID=A0A6G0XYY3_9STRA|nr:hypothetical protein Ae201684_000213 [Aphanomyces euteiches]KAH9091640.1 hypothetical protein Ae201684P_011184 [Aphanomyces euteiches]KAH9129541.1 hypothetical protein AeMF1_000416 [Aphanomyces euteiches]KAH9137418.1 hypothetical protein LEN26_005744 [Aphanomyces euteiches]KAH9157337.1 hypothetical protein AeRB84_000809 [Aphanomyces euteiches]